MMNVLLIGPYYGNAKHGAEVGVFNALKELGCNVSVWDHRVHAFLNYQGLKIILKDNNEDDFISLIKNNSPDVVLILGPGLPDHVLNSKVWKSLSKKLKVNWNSEPLRLPDYNNKAAAQKDEFNIHFTFDESEIPLYKKIGIENIHWLPQAYNPDWYDSMFLPPNQKFSNHLVFVGSIGGKWMNRQHLLQRVKDLGFKVNVAQMFDADKVNQAYNVHDAVLNLGLYCPESGPAQDFKAFGLQQRIFECIGAGKICITNEIPDGTNQLFEHEKNILFYNKDNLKSIIELALTKKVRKPMEANILKIRDEHNYKARMQRLLEIVQ